MLTVEALRWLVSPEGEDAIRRASGGPISDETFLAVSQRLARSMPERQARWAAEQAQLRQRGIAKFSAAGRMFFLREALEQATGEGIARYRADRMRSLSPIFDLGCGIGGDALASAAHGPVVAVDRDRLRLAVLSANAGALSVADHIRPVQADVLHEAWAFPRQAGVFVDPSRRVLGRRVRAPEAYEPPLSAVIAWAGRAGGLAVKLSPAIRRDAIEGLDAEIEFISEGGQLKECVLWFGALRSAESRATLLPGPHSLVGPELPAGALSPIRTYLYEPDPAVMRAGLVRLLARQLDAWQIDPTLGLLTSESRRDSPFATVFRVLDVMPFSLKGLRAELRRRNVGRLTLKKRGSAVDTDDLARRLRPRGEADATVLLTRVGGRPLAVFLEPLNPPATS